MPHRTESTPTWTIIPGMIPMTIPAHLPSKMAIIRFMIRLITVEAQKT